MKKYSCVLFDLDHTLWDFEANAKDTLDQLFREYDLREKGISGFGFFYETFVRINTGLWDLHDRGLISASELKEQRFYKVMNESGLDDFPLSKKFSSDFLAGLPKRNRLMPGTLETLAYLHPKYPMGIVTNGFDEVQSAKMSSSGIDGYFKNLVTSQRAGNKKPSKEIFEFALSEMGHRPEASVMIGDNLLTDIVGARNAGLDTIYFNPDQKPHEEDMTHEIRSISQIMSLL